MTSDYTTPGGVLVYTRSLEVFTLTPFITQPETTRRALTVWRRECQFSTEY